MLLKLERCHILISVVYGWLLFQHMNLPQGPIGVLGAENVVTFLTYRT